MAIVLGGWLLTSCGSGTQASAPPVARPAATAAQGSSPSTVLQMLERALQEQTHQQYAQAVGDFLAVVKADPGNHIAWYDLGVIAHLHAEDSMAISDYQSALVGDPNYIPALYNLAVLQTAGQPKVAASLYEQVIRLQAGNADARLNLGFVLQSLGQAAAAKAQFAAAIRLDAQLASRVPVAEGGRA